MTQQDVDYLGRNLKKKKQSEKKAIRRNSTPKGNNQTEFAK